MNLKPAFQWVKEDKLCDCTIPEEFSTATGICQSCGRNIFQGPRNIVERHLCDKINTLESKLTKTESDLKVAKEALEKCQMNIGDDVYEHATKCDVLATIALKQINEKG